MKFLSYLALLCLLLSLGCKKAPQERVIKIATTNISSTTTFTIIVKNTQTGSVLLDIDTGQGVGNQTYSINAEQGDVFNMQYAFFTQQQQYGQGDIDATCNGQSLWHGNGGSGQNIIITTP